MRKWIPLYFLALGAVAFLSIQIFQGKMSQSTASLNSKESSRNAHLETTIAKAKYELFDGGDWVFKKEDAEIVILNFWAAWCVPCLKEFPSLVELKKKMPEVEVVAINLDEEDQEKEIEKTRKEYKLNFKIIADRKGEILNQFKLSHIPVSVVFVDGKVKKYFEGNHNFTDEKFVNDLKSYLKK